MKKDCAYYSHISHLSPCEAGSIINIISKVGMRKGVIGPVTCPRSPREVFAVPDQELGLLIPDAVASPCMCFLHNETKSYNSHIIFLSIARNCGWMMIPLEMTLFQLLPVFVKCYCFQMGTLIYQYQNLLSCLAHNV